MQSTLSKQSSLCRLSLTDWREQKKSMIITLFYKHAGPPGARPWNTVQKSALIAENTQGGRGADQIRFLGLAFVGIHVCGEGGPCAGHPSHPALLQPSPRMTSWHVNQCPPPRPRLWAAITCGCCLRCQPPGPYPAGFLKARGHPQPFLGPVETPGTIGTGPDG